MAKATLKELFDYAVDTAKKQFEEDGSTTSMFMAHTANNEIIMTVTPWGNENEKQIILTLVRQMFKTKSVDFYVQISEVWTRAFDSSELKSRDPHRQVNSYDDKTESMLVLGCDFEGCKMASMRPIERPYDGSPPRLGVNDEVKPGTFSGRMAELLVGL